MSLILPKTTSKVLEKIPLPKWPVLPYIIEEVRRQGHDTANIDGMERVSWMIEAWCYALRRTWPIMIHDAIAIGKHIEPIKNATGLRRCNVRVVRVGLRSCPEYSRVPELLALLFQAKERLTPMEFYKEFQLIHPFVDGNGRTGKILLNWMNGSLLEPIFPPNDLFGNPPIMNP